MLIYILLGVVLICCIFIIHLLISRKCRKPVRFKKLHLDICRKGDSIYTHCPSEYNLISSPPECCLKCWESAIEELKNRRGISNK